MRSFLRRLTLALALGAGALLAGCGAAAPAAPAVDLAALGENIDVATASALSGRPEVVMLDVREPDEYAAGHIPGVRLIPLGQVAQRLAEIPKDKVVVVTCRSGNRSAQAAAILRQSGYANVHNMQGGINAWQAAGYPVER